MFLKNKTISNPICKLLGWIKYLKHFGSASLWDVYHMTEVIQVMENTHCVISIMVLGVLTCCALLHFVWFERCTGKYIMESNWKLMLYESELGHNT